MLITYNTNLIIYNLFMEKLTRIEGKEAVILSHTWLIISVSGENWEAWFRLFQHLVLVLEGKNERNVSFNDALDTFVLTVIWRLTYGKEPFRLRNGKPAATTWATPSDYQQWFFYMQYPTNIVHTTSFVELVKGTSISEDSCRGQVYLTDAVEGTSISEGCSRGHKYIWELQSRHKNYLG